MNRGRAFSLLLFTLAAGCGTQLWSAPPRGTPGAIATPPHEKHVIAERPAPPRVTAAMKGEPSGAALAEARLVETTCETMTTEETAARIKTMRAEVDASFKEWHDEQPACWAADREQWAEQHGGAYGNMWGGDPNGGLGLSGIGEGGGGYGVGVGVGSVGTLGHGAGTGQGFGSGRLAGAHASSAPVLREGKVEVTPAKAGRASGTNNQVASVDEADIVKTDGRYVYFAANGALRIAEALNPKIVSVTKLPGASREMFVEGDRAVVYTSSAGADYRPCTYGYDCQFTGDGSTTTISILDIKNRTSPRVIRTIELSGSLMAARRIGDAVHTVVADNDRDGQKEYATWPENLPTCGVAESVVRPKFARLKVQNEAKIRARFSKFPSLSDGKTKKAMCEGVMRTAIRDGESFTSVVSFDLNDDAPPTTATIQSRPGAVFASADGLYLSVVHRRESGNRWYSSPSYSDANEVSEIHRFAIGDKAKTTKYTGSGLVPGHVLNQFSMDEWSGYLRVATTRGRVPDPNVQSVVSILVPAPDGNLSRVGAVTGIAPGEDIRAVRFDGDRGYVVTFKKTDPLFVLDLYQANSPGILGELKIPGFSTYIHRIDPEHLLSIGFDANDHGDFAFFDGVILQLFDVKKATEPRLLHKEKIGSRGSSSEAATDHLAFNYFAPAGLLAVPMTECAGGGDGQNGDKVAFSGLYVYNVDVETGFTRLGGVDHSGSHDARCDTWWSNARSTVKRSVFLDDLVYSVAEDRVKVQRLGHLGFDVADLPLGGDF